MLDRDRQIFNSYGNFNMERNSSNSHHFNLVRAGNLYARDRGLEFFGLALLFCTSGQVMDQIDNIGASVLMTRFDMTITKAAFQQMVAALIVVFATCSTTFLKHQKNKRSLLLMMGCLLTLLGTLTARFNLLGRGKYFVFMLNGGTGYFNSSIWSSAALLSKNAFAGSAFSTLMLLKGLMLTIYPQFIIYMRGDYIEGTNPEIQKYDYDPVFKTLITLAVIGFISGLLIALMDYFKGGKTLWDENEVKIQIPRYSFAIVDAVDREQFILGSGSKPGTFKKQKIRNNILRSQQSGILANIEELDQNLEQTHRKDGNLIEIQKFDDRLDSEVVAEDNKSDHQFKGIYLNEGPSLSLNKKQDKQPLEK